jgi:hypothetical protein
MSMYNMEDIGRFAEGDMDAGEQAKFKLELETNESLKAMLASYQHVNTSLKMKLVEDQADKDLKETLTQLGRKNFNNQASIRPIRTYLVWASGIAAVFVLFLIWSPWQKNLYEQYAPTEMISVAERGDSKTESILQKAVNAFNRRDFTAAKSALAVVRKADPENVIADYYYGIALIETGDLVQARDVLQHVYSGTSVFKYDAAFYVALSFLKEKDQTNARRWLEKIPADAANYDKSRALLNKLK